MDQKLIKSYNKELMKMEMLKHEKIFREQVHELHRLYRVQKLLMSNMERQTNCRNEPNQHQGVVADSSYNRGSVGIIDESEIELTLGPSIYKTSNHNHQKKRINSGRSFNSWNFTPGLKNGRQMNMEEEKHLPWLFQPLSLKLT